jgi:hypothetical protein
MSDKIDYLNLDDSDVLLANDPLLSSTGYGQDSEDIEPLTPLPAKYLTQLPDTNSSDILDISSLNSYLPISAVFGTPSTSHNNNTTSLYSLNSPKVSSPYFSPSPAPSPAMYESYKTTPSVINMTSINQYSDGDTTYLINYGEDINPVHEMDTDNIPGKHSIIKIWNAKLISNQCFQSTL